jgi:diguanylate cyclase (GGDEF)-like protein/PAS domain S-box-containing protein
VDIPLPDPPELEQLIDELDAVVWEARPSQTLEFTYVSAASERILGHAPADFYEDGFWSAHIHPDDRDDAVRTCEAAIARREDHTFEYRWVAGDGRVAWLRDVVRVIDGDPLLLRGVMIDVTARRESEERLRLLLDNAQDCVFSVRLGGDPGFEYISPACERLIGYPPEDFLADPYLPLRLVEPEFKAVVEATLEGHPVLPEVTSWRHRDGSLRWLETVLTVKRQSQGRAVAVEGVVRDVTARVLAEDRSGRAQALFETAFAQAPLGMGLTSLDPDRVDELVAVNDALCNLLGRSREELLSSRMDDFTHPEDRGRSVRLKDSTVRGEIPGFYVEKRYVRPDGTIVWGGLHGSLIRDADGRPIHGLGQVEDISERRALAQELAHRALHDGLTGLPNRQLFMDRLDHALAQRRRAPVEHVAVLFLDVDDLKTVNDSFGHSAGDSVIRQVGARLCATVRPGDTIARLAGDEFTVLCPAMPGRETAVALAGRLLAALEEPIDAEGHRIVVRASIGVALGEPGTEASADVLLAEADEALLLAKELGKQRVQLFDEQLRARARTRRHSAADLRRAVEREELRVHYQPVVHIPTGEIRGGEALVRWEHPERGLLPPADFIPLAERLGVIVDIGRWVLARACADSREWPRDRRGERLWLAVNLSSNQLAEPHLADDLASTITGFDGDPRRISFEITETSIVEEPEGAVRAMRALQDLGVLVAIDDFGKGHSSLAQLKSFPVDTLKLDRLFVRGIEQSERDAALVAAVVAMARALDVQLVAEGIEEPGQRERLVALGCEWGQGFLFGRPMPSEKFAALVSSGRSDA